MEELIEFLKEHNDIEVRFNYDRRHKDVKINIVNVYNPDQILCYATIYTGERSQNE